MRAVFTQELEHVDRDVLLMSGLVATATEDAATALRDGDLDAAQRVLTSDERIDDLQRRVEEQCMSLLARQQPVASDLRYVLSTLRIVATLERMGDLAAHVARISRGAFPVTTAPEPVHGVLVAMAEAAARVGARVRRLMDAPSVELGAELERDDSVLDELRHRALELCRDERVALTRQQTIDVVLLSRFLERLGDHGVSVAHRVGYRVTGDLGADLLDLAP